MRLTQAMAILIGIIGSLAAGTLIYRVAIDRPADPWFALALTLVATSCASLAVLIWRGRT
jgi:uncharacterized membrane protein YeaQ/YmgE (transglycosylase-associated protein family)